MAKKKPKINVLLIASHHGVFLTMESLRRFKKEIDQLIVVIPEEKLAKYSEMEGDEFKNYQFLLTSKAKSLKSDARLFTASFDLSRRVSQSAEFLRDVSATGSWLQVMAGSVVMQMPAEDVLAGMGSKFLMMSNRRAYEGNKRLDMYAMLGQPDLRLHEKQNTDSFIINADHIPEMILPDFFLIRSTMEAGKFRKTSPFTFSGEEELVDYAFTGKQLMDHQVGTSGGLVADYWSVVMNPKVTIDKIYAYPLDVYLPFVSKCKGLIPSVTLDRIADTAKETRDYALAFRQALS